MTWMTLIKSASLVALAFAAVGSVSAQDTQATNYKADAGDQVNAQLIPNTGQYITPTAPTAARFEPLNPNLPDAPQYLAGQAVTSVTSPNGKTLLILTSGFNLLNYSSGPNVGQQNNADSNEYVFVYDISANTPVKKQVLQLPKTYAGIVFDPSGTTFYVSGGSDDNVHIFDLADNSWRERSGSPIALGHSAGVGLAVSPAAAGIAISEDGNKLVVANYYNDSISVLTKTSQGWNITDELDLRPGKINPINAKGVAGGEYPFWVVIAKNKTAYVSSMRDREIDVVDLSSGARLTSRIKVKGQPNRMVLNASETSLLVAEDESDSVDVIDTAARRVTTTVKVGAPRNLLPNSREKFEGHNTNSLVLARNEKALYVTNGNTNEVAVVANPLGDQPEVVGLVPTGWYPTSVSFNQDGSWMYVVNAKSPTGPNPGNCFGLTPAQASACQATNQYNLQLIKAGLQSFPTPSASQLTQLTQQVAINNSYKRTLNQDEKQKLAFLRDKIKHVIYIVKENRTYDQILGDLDRGNGDPSLTQFGEAITPNQHSLARNFVTLDNFYDRSEVSYDGWPWSTSARAPDTTEKQVWVNYGGKGLSYDAEGTNRNINIARETLNERLKANPLTPNDPDILPGQANNQGPDGPNGDRNEGYLWNAALRAGRTVRNYGFFIDLARYHLPAAFAKYDIPEDREPWKTKTVVAYSTNPSLLPRTDPYFRGFDNAFPDYYRFKEWEREFDDYAKGGGNLPSLSLVRFMHDHMGNFGDAIDGVNTPELQQADNDYAVGLLIEKIAHSRYKNNTLIFVIEDDSQDAPDHIDSHRSIAFVAGPYVKQGQVVSSSYNTVDMVRTIEEVLGTKQLNVNDSVAVPMTDAFDITNADWTYKATPSSYLANTSLPIPKQDFAGMQVPKTTHDAKYWASVTKGMDFSVEDRINFEQYNQLLWVGLMGDKPYPESRSGIDLSLNRTKLLSQFATRQKTAAEAGGTKSPGGGF